VTYCEGHCLAYGSATPYLPVCALLRQLWGLSDTTAPAALTDTIEQRLHAAGIKSEEDAALLLQFLDVSGDPLSLAVLSPQERRARTFALLRQLFLHARQRQPLVLAVENLHWSDPTSDEWLAALAAQVGGMAILLLATYRPGYQLPWLAHSWATQVALPPLKTPDSLAVVQAVPGAAQLSARQHQAIVAQATGNPFFLEELTWAAVEHGDPGRTLPLPDTIQAVLAARLDRLPPEAKHLVQIAAVIGPEVPVPLLQRLAGLAEETLQRGLAHLQGAELLYETQLVPEQVYTFKHALTHEVAYSNLLQEQRRALHAQIVGVLETLAGDRQAEQVERLAHHALRGEVWDKALRYSQQAGARAVARSAYREAIVYFEQALEALAHLSPDRPMIEQIIDLRCDLAEVLVPLEQYEQGLTHLRAAETLAEGLADQRRLGCIYRSRANTLRNLQDYEPALTYFQRAHAMATALGDAALQGWVNQEMGMTYFNLGDYRQAMAYLQQVLTALEGELCYQSFGVVGLPSVRARIHMVLCLSELGNFVDGVAYGNEALQVAEAVNGLWERQAVYTRMGHLHVRQGNLRQVIVLLERVAVWGQDATIPLFYRISATLLALAYALTGRTTDAVTMLEQVMRNADSPFNAVTCGEAYLLAGDVDEAYRLAQRALANTRHRKSRGEEARTLWLFGEIAMRRDPPDVVSAATFYQQALALAEELGMRPLQAHCHCGLGTLYAQTGRGAQARTTLAAPIALYRAMEMTFWLPQVEATLAHVG
jgi:tetratricopeptide (TPR) repeat protein